MAPWCIPGGFFILVVGRTMSEKSREQLVVTLLRSLDDWVPGPRTSTGQIVAGGASRGETAEHWFECPRCSGRRSVGNGRAEKPCDRCGGAGRVKGDPYTFGGGKSAVAVARERVTGEAESVLLRRRASDRELRRLELAEKHRRGEVDRSEKEPWERAKEALERSGSFRELRAALVLLRAESEFDYAAVRVVYGGDSELREVGAALQARADSAVEWLASRMPDRIDVPAVVEVANGTGRWANPTAQRERDREIWRLHVADGLNREQIARRLGVDRSTVSRVLAAKAA